MSGLASEGSGDAISVPTAVGEGASEGTTSRKRKIDGVHQESLESLPMVVYEELVHLRQRNAYLEEKRGKLVAKVADLETCLSERQIRSTTKQGKPGHVLAHGDYTLWRSRNSGHVNGSSLLSCLPVKGDKTLVNNVERRGGAPHYIVARAHTAAFNEEFAASVASTQTRQLPTASASSARAAQLSRQQ